MKNILFIAFMSLLLMHCSTFFPVQSFNPIEIHTTKGQELIDLKQALDAGAITQEEYDELKLKIIARLDAPADSTATN